MRDNSYITEKYRQKLRDAKKRQKERNGYINSPEAREKVRLSKLGDKNPAKRLDVREKMRGKRPNFKGSSTSFKKGYNPHNKGKWKYVDNNSDINPKDYRSWVSNIRNRQKRMLRMDGDYHTYGEWELIKKQYNYTCPCCKRLEPEIKLTEDHIVPLSKGGSDKIENIQPLCLKCNLKKHTKIIKF